MIHQTIILEDMVIIATEKNGKIHVTCSDSFNGVQEEHVWTFDEWASVLALAMGVGEENTAGFDSAKLYEVCEPLFKDCEVRLIP